MSEPKQKRKRVTIVCANCKKRKIRCDRGKPACQNCVKANVPHLCFYEAPHWATSELQETISTAVASEAQSIIVANGKSIIVDDSGKLYSNLASEEVPPIVTDTAHDVVDQATLQQEAQELQRELDRLQQRLNFEPFHTPKPSTVDPTDPSNSISVNFYDSYNSLIIKKSFVNDRKPFSEGAMVFKDTYLRTSLFSTFLTFKPKKDELASVLKKYNSISIKAITQGLLFDPKIGPQMFRGDVDVHSVDEKMKGESMKMMEGLVKDRAESLKFKQSFFPSLFGGSTTETGYEELVASIEQALPSVNVYEKYIAYFLENMDSFFPIVRPGFFESIRNGPLKEIDPVTNRFKVNPNHDWQQFAWLATVLVILRISYSGYEMDPTKSDEECRFLNDHPIPIDLITISGKCLGYVNIFKRVNEDLLVCLLFMRIYITFAAEESDFTATPSTDILVSVITYCALHIGLYRDPADFIQYADDPETAMFRRRLWAIIVIINRFEVAIHGRFPMVKRELLLKDNPYLEMMGPNTPIFFMHKQLECMKTMSELDVLSTRVNITTKLGDIRDIVARMEALFAANYPLGDMQENNRDIPVTTKNMSIFKMNLLCSLYTSSVLSSLVAHFESSEESSNAVLFKEFFIKTQAYAMKLVTATINSLDGSYDKYIDPKYSFLNTKLVQSTYTKGAFLILSCILRCVQTIELLGVRKIRSATYPSMVTEIDEKLQLLEEIKSKLLNILVHMNHLAREQLAVKYYSSVKLILWFEHMCRVVQDQGVRYLLDFVEKLETNSRSIVEFKGFILKCTGYDLNALDKAVFDSKNFMMYFGVEDFKQLLGLIDSKGLKVPFLGEPLSQEIPPTPGAIPAGMTPLVQGDDAPSEHSTSTFNENNMLELMETVDWFDFSANPIDDIEDMFSRFDQTSAGGI